MKLTSILFSSICLFSIACNNDKSNSNNSGDSATIDSVAAITAASTTWIVDPKSSSVVWKGTKPTGEHIGTINIKEGSVSSEDGKIIAGNFIIDMSTIVETSNSDKPKSQDKLVTHLKSSDFFSVDSFPISTFAITKVEGITISGNLTIKNITREVKFTTDVKIDGAILKASTIFDLDRTDFGINYNSGKKLKDKVADNLIGDNINFKISLVAYKQ